MALGEITTTDLNSWQYRAAGVLADLVEAGLKAERYPLDWSVTHNGSLRGEVHRYDPKQTDPDRRAIFDEWGRALNAEPVRETPRLEGGMRLTALFRHPTNRGDVKGFLQLEIDGPADGA